MNNNAAANQENDEKEGGFEEMTMEQRKQRNDAVKQRQEDELFEKHINKFIATLEIPCYDRCTNFYYYDILEALSRHLFQQIIDQEREKLEEKNIKDSDTDSMSSLSKSSS